MIERSKCMMPFIFARKRGKISLNIKESSDIYNVNRPKEIQFLLQKQNSNFTKFNLVHTKHPSSNVNRCFQTVQFGEEIHKSFNFVFRLKIVDLVYVLWTKCWSDIRDCSWIDEYHWRALLQLSQSFILNMIKIQQ